jgi:chemotaxis methyl-accepting protein methylase
MPAAIGTRKGGRVADDGAGQPSRGNLDKLVRKICDERGLDLGYYRRSYLERRFAARLRTLGLASYRQYSELLDSDPDEYAHFVQTLTINVTDFFRDPELWDLLRSKVIPELMATKTSHHGRVLRVWSAGCSTGEEAYSLAMAFLDALGDEREHFTLSIHATDLDPDALAVAVAGVYPERKRDHIPAHMRLKYTVDGPSDVPDSFQIAPDVRRVVHFERYSLFDSPPMKLVDVVVCRNVFIYFDRSEQARVLDGFWNALTSDGYLVLGRSEKLSAGEYERFETLDSKERVYRKAPRTR